MRAVVGEGVLPHLLRVRALLTGHHQRVHEPFHGQRNISEGVVTEQTVLLLTVGTLPGGIDD